MNAALVLEIIKLAAALTPAAVELANNLIHAAKAGEITMADIEALQSQLNPMVPKPEVP